MYAILTMMTLAIVPTPKSVVELGGDFGTDDYVVVKTDDESMAPQSYRLTMTNGVVEIRAADPDGHFYARKTLDQLGGNIGDRLPNAIIEDAPSVAVRGVVEGYYGRPWGRAGRLSLLEFMGKLKLNTYIYGPKDDPFHHSRWREPYPEESADEFKVLLAAAKRNHVRFYWAIHLGGGFRKGGAEEKEDFQALYLKLKSMYDLGIRSFAVFFDDFGEADAAFHAKICNFVSRGFIARHEGCTPLLVCPNVYWGLGKNDYCRTLGAELDPGTQIIWTGKGVCHDIVKADAECVAAAYRREPFVWWNFPVNDYCRTRLLLGRTYGLEPAPVSGFVANPMENCEANKIAIFGVADWCWNQEAFDSAANWERAFGYLYSDPDVAKAMRVLAEHNADPGKNVHGYRREESAGAKALVDRATAELEAGGKLRPETIEALRGLFGGIAEAADTLKRKLPVAESRLWWEIEGWVVDQEVVAKSALKMLDFMNAAGDMDRTRIIMDLRQLKCVRQENDARHLEKFRKATFPDDAARVEVPRASMRELAPFVECLYSSTLGSAYREKTGEDFIER